MNAFIKTDKCTITGNEREYCNEYLGIRFGRAERFKYATLEPLEGSIDATRYGDCCHQTREFYPKFDVPERYFYYREFREGSTFTYSEDCLNLNIYTPKKNPEDVNNTPCAVIVFFHGGAFNSMAASENYIDGEEYAKRNIILVSAEYRVGCFGYFVHPDLDHENGHNGNFGLADQVTALHWVKENIKKFGGDPKNVTVIGQSAGALSIQYMCLSDKCKGLFKHAIMMSGSGRFPYPALPRPYKKNFKFWKKVMELAGTDSLEEFRALPAETIIRAMEEGKKELKGAMFVIQPVNDNFFFKGSMKRLFKNVADIDYMNGFTNNDMFTILFANMAIGFAVKNSSYLYFFDADAPGDNNQAFHSADLRYVFGTLGKSFRNYNDQDQVLSQLMIDYIAAFANTGNPNGAQRPVWRTGFPALTLSREYCGTRKLPLIKLLKNTFVGDPK